MIRKFRFLLLASALLVGLPLEGRAQEFVAGRSYGVPEHPNAVSVGDFNGDGHTDLAVPSYSPNTLAILLSDGNGQFLPPVTFPAGTGPRFAAVGDFNHDGRQDVAVANQDSGDVSVLLANGPGSFAPQLRFSSGLRPRHLVSADLNEDGHLDLVVANEVSDTVTIFVGDGTGRFALTGTFVTGDMPRATAIADFNEDTHLDIAVSNSVSNTVQILIGDGAGGFMPTVAIPVGPQPFFLASGDLNGDGHADLAVPFYGGTSVGLLFGDGHGNFSMGIPLPAGLNPRSVRIAMLNPDARADLIVANYGSNTISVYLGDDVGGFVAERQFGVGFGPFAAVPFDCNEDGYPDVVTADRDGHTLTVLKGDGTGLFNAPRAFSTGLGPRGLTVGDLNGDGRPDVVTANTSANSVSVLIGLAEGVLAPPVHFSVKTNPYSPLIADFNGDGLPDIAVANGASNNVSVLLGDGDGHFQPSRQSSTSGGARSITAADFNLDGKVDLAAANFAHGTIAILLGKGDGTFNSAITQPAGVSPSAIVVGDFNLDTLLDLAVANSGNNNVRIFVGNGAGAFTPAGTTSVGTAPSALAIGDLNGDDIADLVTANEASNSVSILLGLGNGTFTVLSPLPAGARPLGVSVRDLDADGDQDLVVANAEASSLMVLRGNGDGTFSAPIVLPAGSFSRGIAFGDFNGDERPDVASVNGTGHDVWITLNRMGAPMDLAVGITNQATSVTRGQMVAYDVTVSNTGPTTATEVRLSFVLPTAMIGPTATPTVGAYDIASGVWTGLNLAPNSQIRMTLTGVVGFTSSETFSVSATVSPSADATDPAPADNVGEDTDLVLLGETDLTVSITNGVTGLRAGDAVTYTIVVTNSGPTDAIGSLVEVSLPGVLTGATWTCSAAGGASCAPSGSSSIIETVSLPSGGSLTYTVRATVDLFAATGTLTVTASVGAPVNILETYPANDSATDSDPVAGEDPPIANPQTIAVTEDSSVSVILSAAVPDGEPVTFTIVSMAAHGALSGTMPNLTYTPSADFFGMDSFVFRASDGVVSTTATISINVTPTNDSPVALGQSVAVLEDTATGIALAATDVDGDGLTFTILTPPTHGTLSGVGATRTYIPNQNFSGSDSFAFIVSDGTMQSLPALVSMVVASVNDAPVVVTPFPDLTVSGLDLSASLTLAGRFSDLETPESTLIFSASSSNPSLVSPSVGGTLALQFAAGQSGTATVTVRATDGSGAWVEDAFVVTVVRPQATVSVSDASRGEGSSTGIVFTLTLSNPANQPVSVSYATLDGSAVAGIDYSAMTGTVTFATGVTTRTVTIATSADVLDEDDETFSLILGNPVGLTMGDGIGTGTIIDNDTSKLSLVDISFNEGSAGPQTAAFTITLSVPSAREISVDFATVASSAVSDVDYTPTTGTLIFPAGSTNAQVVGIEVNGDQLDEANEVFFLSLSNAVNAAISRSTGRATIVDDDDPPSVTISDPVVVEGNAGTRSLMFTLTLSAPSGLRTRVSYSTEDGTATAGVDYVARSGEISFDPGITTRTLTIAVSGDTTAEPDEMLFVNLHSPTNLTIASGQGIGTIVDDDGN